MADFLRKYFARKEFKDQEGLANIRQEYYSWSPAKRKEFKRNIQALAQACKPFDCGYFTVNFEYKNSINDDEGNEVFSAVAKVSAKAVLKAIELWDSADEQTHSFS